MRYTIQGEENDRARALIRRDDLTRREAWRITLTGDRLRGIGRTKSPLPVHRDRVRHGAWEASPRAVLVTGAHRDPGGWTMPGGRRLEVVHPRGHCQPGPCVIHNPMLTHMDTWPLHWRDDRGIFERICRHSVGHPAPEQAAHIGPGGMIHGCCGCCVPPNPCAIPDEATRAAEARSGSGVGTGEGPADSDGSQTYKRPLWADSPDLAEETR